MITCSSPYPYLNRWVQPDTIIPELYNVLDWDRYAAMRNNTVKYIDLSGHEVCDEFGFCFEKGKLSKGKPIDFFKQVLYRSPIHDEDENKR